MKLSFSLNQGVSDKLLINLYHCKLKEQVLIFCPKYQKTLAKKSVALLALGALNSDIK